MFFFYVFLLILFRVPFSFYFLSSHTQVCNLLDTKKVEFPSRDHTGHTLLHYAVRGNLLATVPLLIAAGMDPNQKYNSSMILSYY
jgi:ankyrin repeat protein